MRMNAYSDLFIVEYMKMSKRRKEQSGLNRRELSS